MKSIIAISFALAITASAVPNLLNYQGKLLDPDTSQALADGPHALVFNLYDSATDGTHLWGPFSISANTSNGFFNVILGPEDTAGTPRSLTSAFSGSDAIFLEIKVDSGAPLSPRQQILTSPFAFRAANADNSIQAAQTPLLTGTWNVPSGQSAVIQINGSPVMTAGPADVGTDFDNGHVTVKNGFGFGITNDAGAIRRGVFAGSSEHLSFWAHGGERLVLHEDRFLPFKNATSTTGNGSETGIFLGASNNAWKAVYAMHGTIRSSDERLKTNISDLEYGLDEIMKLRPTRYNWKANPDGDSELGLIAQEVLNVVPESVNIGTDEDQTLGITYTDLVPVLIKGMQEQQAQIEALKAEISELRNSR